MARTLLTPIAIKGPYPGTAGALALDFAFTAADVANGNAFKLTGKEILLVSCPAVGYTITLTSVADNRKRTADITAYAVGIGLYSAFNFLGGLEGWLQTDGNVYIAGSNAGILFAVLQLP